MGNPDNSDDQGPRTLVREEAQGARATLVKDAEAGTVVRDGESSTPIREQAPAAPARRELQESAGASIEPASGAADVTRESAGRYQLRREFGRGGQAVVWLAHDRHIGRDVALKLLAPGGPGSSDHVSRGTATVRFLREARITGQLEHPSIVPVYEVGQRADGSLYYTQKLVRGRTLRAALDACKGLVDRLALLSHFVDVCQAVAYAHGRGVVHRDLKPENVMVGEFGETVVLDWGLAKVKGQADPRERSQQTPVELESPAAATRVGAILGTPLYMSPEQALGRLAEVDERSDVWALGAVLYEILTGRPPFLGQNPTQVLFKVANAPLEPVKKQCAEAPPELTAVAERALKKERSQRYGTARELAQEVAAFQSGARVLAYSYTTWELARKLVRRNPLASALAAGALLVLIVSSVIISRAHREAVSYLADALLARARAAEREHRWAYAATWRAAARTHEDRAEARWGQRLAEELAIAPRARLLGHQGEVWSVAYLPDGTAVSGGEDGTVRLWSRAGAELASLAAHDGRVSAVAATAQGDLIASGDENGVVRIWDARTRRELHSLEADSEVWSLAFSPDGKLLAESGVEQAISLFDAHSGAPAGKLLGHHAEVAAVVFSHDGKQLASVASDGEVLVWDRATLQQTRRFSFSGHELWSVSFSPDDGELAIGGDHGLLRTAPLAGQRRRFITGHTRVVSAVVYSPDGTLLASASRDGSVRLWDARTQTALARLDANERAVNGLVFSPDGRTLATAQQDNSVRLWALPEHPGLRAIAAHTADIRGLAFSPDGNTLASSSEDGLVRTWDASTGAPLHTVPAIGGYSRAVAFSRDGKLLASAHEDGKLRLIDAATGQVSFALLGHKGFVSSVAFSPASDLLLSGGEDGTARLWDLQRRVELRQVSLPGKVHGVAFSPDGKLFVGGGTDRLVHVWNTASGAQLAQMPGHTETIRAVAFSPDGAVIASGSHDRSIRVYDASSYQLLRVLDRHEGQIRAVAFSRDGAVIASACTDRELRLWETKTGALLAELPWHETGVLAIAWSADGRQLASGSGEGLVDLLRIGDARELPPPEQSLNELLGRYWLKLARLELVPDLAGRVK